MPNNLPDYIIADISKLKLGHKLYTAELKSDDYTFLHPDNTVVCQVRTSRASMNIVEEDEEEATAEAAKSGETSEAQASEEAQNPAEGE